jgi:hypothetical protein
MLRVRAAMFSALLNISATQFQTIALHAPWKKLETAHNAELL